MTATTKDRASPGNPSIRHHEGCNHITPKTANFNITSIKIGKYNSPWELVIADHSGNVVKSFSGKGYVPPAISWDWKDTNGNLLKPGIYYYYIQWNDRKLQVSQSARKVFYVKKTSRTVYVDLRFSPDMKKEDGSIVEIKFSN